MAAPLELFNQFSIFPPFKDYRNSTAVEIGNWTLRGSSTILKKEIRLTPDIPNQFGQICQRVPMYSENWTFITQISGTDELSGGGSGFSLFYTKELCHSDYNYFHGFSIWTNSTNSTYSQKQGTPVYFLESNGENPKFLPLVRPITFIKSESIHLLIQKQGNSIFIQFSPNVFNLTSNTPSDLEATVKSQIITKTISNVSNGYFTISAFSGDKGDGNDYKLHYIDVHLDSPFNEPPNDETPNLNRKLLDLFYLTYKQRKYRRRRQMPFFQAFQEEINSSDRQLSTSKLSLKAGLALIQETLLRSKMMANLHLISHVTQISIEKSMKDSMKTISESYEMASLFPEAIQMVKSTTENSLKEISNDIKQQMSVINEESRKFIFDLFNKNQKVLAKAVLKDVNIPEDKSLIETILVMICVIEGIIYLIFFFTEKSRTNNFSKKHD